MVHVDSGRTLDAYRHDLRGFFQWAADMQLTVLAATRPHIELFRSWMEERGLAGSTISSGTPFSTPGEWRRSGHSALVERCHCQRTNGG
jgi:hypothetical protein